MERRDLLIGGGAMALMAGGSAALAQPAMPRPSQALSAAQFGAQGDGRADDTAALQAALDAAFGRADGALLMIPPGQYRISRTLKIAPKENITRQAGIFGPGARLISNITNGDPVLEIQSTSTFRFLLVQGLDIHGSGRDGDGIRLICRGNQSFLYNFCLRDLVVQNCGRDGCHMLGNVFEGQIANCYFRNNKHHGASFHHDKAGGILSAVRVIGGVFGENGESGAALRDGCYDVSFHGSYFLLNRQYGLVADNGCTLLSSCGFENNHEGAPDFQRGNAGIALQGFATLVGCTAYSMFRQTHLLKAYLTGQLVLVGCSGSGDAAAAGAGLARISGDARGRASVIGCSGAVRYEGGFEGVAIGGPVAGLQCGSHWQSRSLAWLGSYALWVDARGRLRMKNGAPEHDEDGAAVGA